MHRMEGAAGGLEPKFAKSVLVSLKDQIRQNQFFILACIYKCPARII